MKRLLTLALCLREADVGQYLLLANGSIRAAPIYGLGRPDTAFGEQAMHVQ